MSNDGKNKTYLQIGAGRLLNIEVFLDNEKVYEGKSEDAPEEIKELKYSDIKVENKITYYAYSELN